MPDHKFRVGQIVRLSPTIISRNIPDRVYEVTKQLPESVGEYRYREYQYRIKSISEPYERVVRESELHKT
jgi:hypothetical protein